MVKVGIVGVGGIASTVHIPRLQSIPECKITAICDVDREQLDRVGDRLGIDKACRFTDYEALVACSEVDAVEICTANHLHVPIAVAAVKAGKAIEIEKPLACDLASTAPLQEALSQSPVPNMMSFSFRFRPATRYAKWILEQGMLGDIVGVKVAYLKSSGFMVGRRMEWRFIKEYAGTGVLGDLGAHLVDLTRYLIGEIHSVCGDAGTIVKRRKCKESEEYATVETDDYCNFLAKVGDDIAASFVITRCAYGNSSTLKYEIFGTEGMLSFDLSRPEEISLCIGVVDRECNGTHTVRVPKRFAADQEQTFVDLVRGETVIGAPTVADGVECQRVLDALLLSTQKRAWVEVDKKGM